MKFSRFTVLKDEFSADWPRHCTFITYMNEDGTIYTFAYNVLHCLGYEKPHEKLDELVEEKDKHKVPEFASGIYLKEDTITKLSENNQTFLTWFTNYISGCKSGSTSLNCPH